MSDLTEQTAIICATNVEWDTRVKGSRGDIYAVVWGRLRPDADTQYGWNCTCPARVPRCRHIMAVDESNVRCAWNAGLDPGEYCEGDGGLMMLGAQRCPECGGPTEVVRVAV